MTIEEWGEIMKLARKAAGLATEDMRAKKVITDPLESTIMLYTDDPTAASFFIAEPDLAAICKVSAIEGVCIIMGEKFPPAAFEAPRPDPEFPRVAALWFPPLGEKCPRCRNYTRQEEADICAKCEQQVEQIRSAT